MKRIILLIMCVLTLTPLTADDLPSLQQTWWEKRDQRSDIYYPHKLHYETMEKEGDSCLLCHTFQKNEEHDETKRKPLNIIANEPLMGICHHCHVDEKRAPWRCDLCHDDNKKIWPADHNSGYIQNHGEDSQQNMEICANCHLDRKFCTDCHFSRDTLGTGYHPLGYVNRHGLESRMMPANCSQCHNSFYCKDCHNQ
jgi:hypothetical protein